MKKRIDKIIMYLPFFTALIISLCNIKYSVVTSSLPGIEKVLESVINFTSIMIGILLALFGVVVTLSDSDVMKKLQQNKGDKAIFRYSIETLLTNFIVLILSIVLQSLLEFKPLLYWTDIFLYFWFFWLLFSIFSSIRTIYYLLLISFNQNNRSNRPEPSLNLSDSDKEKLRSNSTTKK